VEVHGCPNGEWSERVYGEIDDEISALVAELQSDPASELLRGRTFARVLQ
jgi:hypothetical protein